MDNSSVFQRSALGREKIRDKDLGILPRQARTLLFLIDSEKIYADYFEAFNNNQVFIEAGGIALLFELLEDLQYIEQIIPPAHHLSEQVAVTIQAVTTPRQTPAMSYSQALSSIDSDESEATKHDHLALDDTILSTDDKIDSSSGSSNNASTLSYDAIRSDLAAFIEKNAPASDAWGYLLSLEKCDNAMQLQALVQSIYSSTTGTLKAGMPKYYQALQR